MGGTTAFARAVAFLRSQRKTVTTVESSCGGLISSGIMAVPGSSAVYYGGSVSYNTKKARKLLLDDGEMHAALVAGVEPREGESEADQYIRSKHDWTARTAVAFCEALQTDFAVAEGGAVGPTFTKEGLTSGFAVLCVAGRSAPGEAAKVLAQRLVRSDHADRERNMKAFAEHAAELLCETVGAVEAAAVGAAGPAVGPPLLDRDSVSRTDELKVAAHLSSPRARFVVCQGDKVLLHTAAAAAAEAEAEAEAEAPPWRAGSLALLPRAEATAVAPAWGAVSYLGQLSYLAGGSKGVVAGSDAPDAPDEPRPVFAVDAGASATEDGGVTSGSGPATVEFADTRLAAAKLEGTDSALALYAHGLLAWQRRSAFCASCGGAAALVHAGHARRCGSGCGGLTFPRQDPAIIVAVQSADRGSLLLARSRRHPPRLHTALAGFVEVGEAFEDAVAREVFQETETLTLNPTLTPTLTLSLTLTLTPTLGLRRDWSAHRHGIGHFRGQPAVAVPAVDDAWLPRHRRRRNGRACGGHRRAGRGELV